jgi:hypothetical protein
VVCDALISDGSALLGVDVAVAFYGGCIIIETKVRAGTEVAVEIFHFVAFFVLGVEGAEIWLCFYHILKSEIGDDLLVTQV